MTLRPVEPIREHNRLKRNPIAPPPKIAWLALDQLVIDENYQRSLSGQSNKLIRRLVENWDWNCFKPLSVAAVGDGRYEIIDGQHTAIAAATHGAVETLPCLVLDATTLAQRSAAFVGINRDRLALTPFALYRARLAAEDPEAVAVDAALVSAGAALVESIRYDVEYPPGTVACIGTLLQVVRRGGKARLARLLRLCMAADISPIPSGVLKGLEEIVRAPSPPDDARLSSVLSDLGGDTLIDMATERRKRGLAPDGSTAVMQVILNHIEPERAA
jgi:hypothetical protein